MEIGNYVKPIDDELKFILDKDSYLIENVKCFNKNSIMLKLKGHPLYFNSKDFELCK